jgi:hypothetical protein
VLAAESVASKNLVVASEMDDVDPASVGESSVML